MCENADRESRVDSSYRYRITQDLELPESLFHQVTIEYLGLVTVQLAAGKESKEEFYRVRVPFDGGTVEAEASFVSNNTILIGTRLINDYLLLVDFPKRHVELNRSNI